MQNHGQPPGVAISNYTPGGTHLPSNCQCGGHHDCHCCRHCRHLQTGCLPAEQQCHEVHSQLRQVVTAVPLVVLAVVLMAVQAPEKVLQRGAAEGPWWHPARQEQACQKCSPCAAAQYSILPIGPRKGLAAAAFVSAA